MTISNISNVLDEMRRWWWHISTCTWVVLLLQIFLYKTTTCPIVSHFAISYSMIGIAASSIDVYISIKENYHTNNNNDNSLFLHRATAELFYALQICVASYDFFLIEKIRKINKLGGECSIEVVYTCWGVSLACVLFVIVSCVGSIIFLSTIATVRHIRRNHVPL
eukprot:GHVR01068183.1.p1 GENE.GHVR01068183.1~~GHVR01068183.1.p1  ORF type:complete len:165 (+),score=34.38 GHVR01068183.1:159-653(+)